MRKIIFKIIFVSLSLSGFAQHYLYGEPPVLNKKGEFILYYYEKLFQCREEIKISAGIITGSQKSLLQVRFTTADSLMPDKKKVLDFAKKLFWEGLKNTKEYSGILVQTNAKETFKWKRENKEFKFQ